MKQQKTKTKRRGGCGCDKIPSISSFFKGGKRKQKSRRRSMKGGYTDIASFPTNAIPSWSYYPYNSTLATTGDPSDSFSQPSSRLIPDFQQNGTLWKGGRRRRRRRQTKRRIIRGGSLQGTNILSAYPLIGSSSGAQHLANIYTGTEIHPISSPLPSYYTSNHPAMA